jgi:signal transduction histidine kinase
MEMEPIAIHKARIRAKGAMWDLDVAVFLFAILALIMILRLGEIEIEIVGPVAMFGLAVGWLMGWRHGRQLYWSFYNEELVKLTRELLEEKERKIEDDLNERKRAEKRGKELQQELILSSRLASVGEMASGIAHEINNPLTGVTGFAQLLMKKDIPDDVRKDVEIIYEGAQRVASITRRLLTFAGQQRPKLEHVDINDVIGTTLDMRAYEMKSSNIKVTTELDPELPETMADAGQLQQVFLNIILNAEQEMVMAHKGGNLLVKTERMDNTIKVSIKDDGPGIAKENLEKIFDPFFTTREVGEGAGLGLSVCHGIVKGHGGKVYAESRLGKGATFIVELPIVISPKS